MIGWICPKCNKSVNPNMNHCDCGGYETKPYTPITPYEPYTPIWITPYPFQPITTITANGNTVLDDTTKYTVII